MTKILFIRAPRTCWPYVNEQENMLMAQALPCLAAVLLKDGFSVKILDCFSSKLGWNSCRNAIITENPEIVCISESEFSLGHEGVKAAKFAKEINPRIVTIAGGLYFSAEEEMPKNYPIDFIVRGEGEVTLVELVKELQKPKSKQNFHKIKGLVYREKNRKVITSPRPLIKNLDTLPFPAYNLMDMDYYARDARNWNVGLTTIHHSRGCDHGCAFCSCWLQMAQRNIKNGKEILTPVWRTKSVKRTIAEIEFLYKKYSCKKLQFVDDTWNLDLKWDREFADAVKKKGLNIEWSAFMRIDYISRDEKEGVMKGLVESGLVHAIIGIERACDKDLKDMNKSCKAKVATKTLEIIRKKYPSVFLHLTFIIGIDNETRESILELSNYVKKLNPDYFGISPLVPIKNTPLWEGLEKKSRIEVKDPRCYDWLTAVMPSKHISRKEIQDLLYDVNYFTDRAGLLNDIKGVFLQHGYRRKKHAYSMEIRLRMLIGDLKEKIGIKSVYAQKDKFSHTIIPEWYNN